MNQELTDTSREMSTSMVNPYAPPNAVSVVVRRTGLPAFVTGLIGLAMGAGFYGMLCSFLVIAYFVDASGMPTPRERGFMIAATVFHAIPLVIWVSQHRKLYQFSASVLWILAITCWLLMPLSGAIMVLNLGI